MTESPGTPPGGGPLHTQLCWFIRLRWLAAAVVLAGTLVEWVWLEWYGRTVWMLGLGITLLAYNAVLWMLVRTPGGRTRTGLLLLSSVQIFFDLACLTLLMLWTGGINSPLMGFFVFHMVFASLLLPRFMAYGSATVAIAMAALALWYTQQLPVTRHSVLMAAGWVITLLLTVHLTNHITRALRRKQKRLVRQNKRIRAMSEQLRQQQEALIQHEKMVAMGQMAAGVTHEIANPLASMDSVLQLLQRRPDRMRPDSVQTLREQVQRITQIIQQMKAFAHPTEQQMQVLPLNEVVEQGIAMVRFDHRLRKVQILKELSPGAGELALLPQALQQVLVNLIINALDAVADVEQPMLVIRTDRRDEWCMVEVADNGHGIKPEHMNRLFEPFFTTKPVGKGTGLGLSISYSLIHKQGGSISVRSSEGKGTTFTIRLPATQQSTLQSEAGA